MNNRGRFHFKDEMFPDGPVGTVLYSGGGGVARTTRRDTGFIDAFLRMSDVTAEIIGPGLKGAILYIVSRVEVMQQLRVIQMKETR